MSITASNRRNVFIKKAFQGRIVSSVFLLMVLSGLCSTLLIYWITGGDLQAQSESAHINIANAWARLGLALLIGNVAAILIAGTLAAFVVMYAAHKITGPLYRFEKLCEQVGNGDLDIVIAIREKDQIHDLAKAFLEMVTKLSARKQLHQKCVRNIINQIGQLKLDHTIALEQRHTLEQLELTAKQLVE